MYLVLGSLLLVAVGFDFFYTTLAGSGAAHLTSFVSLVSHKILQLGVRLFGRRVYHLSGMLLNLMLLAVWVGLVWLGLFLIFSYDPGGIVNNSRRAATAVERLYFTGYTLSTLGLGNFEPTTPFFEVLTSTFSFFGFIFFTTSMTYLISIASAVTHKRSLALTICNLGRSPLVLMNNLLEKDTSYTFQIFCMLQQMVDKHSVNHQAYPELHYYSNPDNKSSFNLNMAVLDEALTLMLKNPQGREMAAEIAPLRESLTSFLQSMEGRYSSTLYRKKDNGSNLPKPGEIPHGAWPDDPELKPRRKILGGLLRSESFGWRDVYSR